MSVLAFPNKTEHVPPYQKSSRIILIVEDNLINSAVLCDILEEDYDILLAENGKDALEKIEEFGSQILLVLLDVTMPIMDGYTFLKLLKSDSRFAAYVSIPVIVTTSNDSEEDEIRALSLGATDFVRKPYRPAIVKHRITSIINLRETSAMVNLMKYDRLTRLYSKEYFYSKAAEIVRSNPHTRYDIICSDIENFSMINEMFGHEAGNELLLHTAAILREIVKNKGICCRLDTDTFAMLIERTSVYSDAFFASYVKKINSHFDRYRLRIDFGVYPLEHKEPSINMACDRALYAIETIKHNFERCLAYYDDSLRQKKIYTQSIIDSMESALTNKEFVLYYQPKYDLKDEHITGAEALVRWISPEKGFLLPDKFIPIFEKNGFIGELDEYVWEEACSMIRKCIDANIPIVPISVNVSRSDLHKPQLIEIFNNLVEKYRLDPALLHLEITESVCIEHPEDVIHTISELRRHGFIISMDDFGSGYSSLNMLSTLPIDILKLDMKVVQNISKSEKEKGIIRFVINLAKWMNLTVIAEGAETQAHINELKSANCDQVQGYFFSKPLPEADFIHLLLHANTK